MSWGGDETRSVLRLGGAGYGGRGEVGVTEEITAFANARIFDGASAELREGCVRVAAGTIAEAAGGPGPGPDR